MSSRKTTPPHIPLAEFTRHLGSGGFADVHLYHQRVPERDIAVKVMRPEASAEETGAFEAEANLMAKMSAHPAILSVFGAGVSEDNRAYLIMEYCPPPHLGIRARRQPLSVPAVLDIGIRIAGAVETLHRSGVLHRDIKPANILMTQFDHPVLTDFGLAVTVEDAEAKAGEAGFSIPWAPPEQVAGEGHIGPTLDVYSLGATLHTLLKGHSPFEIPDGDNREISLINRVMRDPVPPIGREDVPPELERILAVAMAKNPAQRYPSVWEFARALQRIQEELHLRATPLDVIDGRVKPAADKDEEDATRVRAFTIVDSEKGTPEPPAPWVVTPTPAQDSDDETRVRMPRINQDEDATRVRIPRIEVTDAPPPSHAQKQPTSEAPPAASPTHQDPLEQDDSDNSRPRTARIIALVIITALATTLATIGAWTLLTSKHSDTPQSQSIPGEAPAELPVDTQAQPITGLKGMLNSDGTVTFTWNGSEGATEYLYTVLDPLSEQRVRHTSDTTVNVDKIAGSTCVRVVIRYPNGKTSTPATECVVTP